VEQEDALETFKMKKWDVDSAVKNIYGVCAVHPE